VFGARQMGGGFGGGVLALVECQRAAQVASAVTARTGLPAIVCAPADGAGMLA
jgi:galactokinase